MALEDEAGSFPGHLLLRQLDADAGQFFYLDLRNVHRIEPVETCGVPVAPRARVGNRRNDIPVGAVTPRAGRSPGLQQVGLTHDAGRIRLGRFGMARGAEVELGLPRRGPYKVGFAIHGLLRQGANLLLGEFLEISDFEIRIPTMTQITRDSLDLVFGPIPLRYRFPHIAPNELVAMDAAVLHSGLCQDLRNDEEKRNAYNGDEEALSHVVWSLPTFPGNC
jgi:hypothetical protein